MLLLVACFPATGKSQTADTTFHLLLKLQVETHFVTADNLGNAYILTKAGALEKYASDGTLAARYTNNQLGSPTSVDPTNPLKTLVWYADFQTIVFLDRSLTELGRLDLNLAGYPNVRVVASTPDGNLWFYDESAFMARKISAEGVILFESQNLSLLSKTAPVIGCIRDDGNQVYLSNASEGLVILDAYGQSAKTRLMPMGSDFQIIGSKLFRLTKGVMRMEDLKAFSAKDYTLPMAAPREEGTAWLGPRRLFVQNDKELYVFSY